MKTISCIRCGGIPYITHPRWAPFNNGLCFRCNGSGIDPYITSPVDKKKLGDRDVIERQVTEQWNNLGFYKLGDKLKKRATLMKNAYITASLKGNVPAKEGALKAFKQLCGENNAIRTPTVL